MVFAQVNYKAFQGYFFVFSIVFVTFQTRLSIVVCFFFPRFNQDHSQPNLIWNYKVSSPTNHIPLFFNECVVIV